MENIIVKIYNNYKQFCVENKLDIKTGKSKQLQMKEVDRLYNWHKEGNKIVIDCEKENPSEKIDGRKGHSGKHNNHVMPNNKYRIKNDKFKMLFDVENSSTLYHKGVYGICLDNKIYIGSTMVSFYERIQQHMYDKYYTYYDLLQYDDCKVKILEVMDNSTEKEIREMEQSYIDLFLTTKTGYELINHAEETYCYKLL